MPAALRQLSSLLLTIVLAQPAAALAGPPSRAEAARDEEIRLCQSLMARTSDPEQLAELHFQLAEAYASKARAAFVRELSIYEAAAEGWSSCVRKRSAEACPSEPVLSDEYENHRSHAIETLRSLLQSYPQYSRRSEVLFTLAQHLIERADTPSFADQSHQLHQEAMTLFGELAALAHGNSRSCHALVAIGELAFDQQQFDRARRAYNEAAQADCPSTQSYATYRLAWTEYSAGAYPDAVRLFKDVIARADRKPPDAIRLKAEALRGLLLAFEKANEVDTAIAYYVNLLGKLNARSYINKLGALYMKRGAYSETVAVFRYLLQQYPQAPSSLEWYMNLAHSHEQAGRRELVLDEVRRMVQHAVQMRRVWGKSRAW